MYALNLQMLNNWMKDILDTKDEWVEEFDALDCIQKYFDVWKELDNNTIFDKNLFITYKDGLMYMANNQLDYRNEECENWNLKLWDLSCNLILNDINRIDSICIYLIYFPIIMISMVRTNSYKESSNFEPFRILIEKQFNNPQVYEDIHSSYIYNAIMTLYVEGLFPETIVRQYATSASNQVKLGINSLMGDYDKRFGTDNTYSCTDSNRFMRLVFPTDLKSYQILKSDEICSAYTERDFIKVLIGDMKAISDGNRMNQYFVKRYLRPYIQLICLKIEEINSSVNPLTKENKLISLIKLVVNEAEKYKHEITRVVMIVLKVFCDKYASYKQLNHVVKEIGITNLINNPELFNSDICNIIKLCIMSADELGLKNYGKDIQSAKDRSRISEMFYNQFADLTNVDEDESKSSCESVTLENCDFTSSRATTILTEGFEIGKDGTIKIKLKKNTTLMDEYASNHRLLKLNLESKDYEAMKYNLVYVLLLIESCDSIIHNSKIDKSDEIMEMALKTRKFASNDLATYLPRLKIAESTFDLNKFYEKVKADNETISIDTVSTIHGVKQIIKAVMM